MAGSVRAEDLRRFAFMLADDPAYGDSAAMFIGRAADRIEQLERQLAEADERCEKRIARARPCD